MQPNMTEAPLEMSGMEVRAMLFVSQTIKDSMVFVQQHSRPCSQLSRPQTGHSELSAKLLNAKQLRSDRGN